MADIVNPFFNSVTGDVRSAIAKRIEYHGEFEYSKTPGMSKALNWLVSKRPYAEATVYRREADSLKALRTLSIPKGNLMINKNDDAKGLYRKFKDVDENSNDSNRDDATETFVGEDVYVPKPHITSIKISTDGSFAALLKADMSFTLYTLNDLESYMSFLSVGYEVSIKYGWVTAEQSAAEGKEGKYHGVIYNFTYQLNGYGGFDCNCSLIGTNASVIGSSIKASSAAEDGTKDNKDVKSKTIDFASLLLDIANTASNQKGGTYFSTLKGVTFKPYYYVLKNGLELLNKGGAGGSGNSLTPRAYADKMDAGKAQLKKDNPSWSDDKATIEAIGKNESGGKYDGPVNPTPGSTAGGKYGFTNATWEAYMGKTDANGNPWPKKDGKSMAGAASPADQERAMGRMWRDNQKKTKDPKELAAMHYLGHVPKGSEWDTVPGGAPGGDAADNGGKYAGIYLPLCTVIDCINYKVFEKAGGKNVKDIIKIHCNKDVTQSSIPASADFCSADPRKVAFPGFGKYSDTLNFDDITNSAYQRASHSTQKEGAAGAENITIKKGDTSKILVAIDTLLQIEKDLSNKEEDTTKEQQDTRTLTFVNQILQLINDVSGGFFKLTMVTNVKRTDNKDDNKGFWYIVDTDYNGEDISPLIIKAVTHDGFKQNKRESASIVRSMNLSAKLPDKMQAVAYVAARSNFAQNQTVSLGEIISGQNNREDNVKFNPADLKAAKDQVASGANDDAVNNLKGQLRAYYTDVTAKGDSTSGAKLPNAWQLVPLDLSITLDGINGFNFGNVISTNYLPSRYFDAKGQKIIFTVSKVEHSISEGDWTTTLSTLCRLKYSAL